MTSERIDCSPVPIRSSKILTICVLFAWMMASWGLFCIPNGLGLLGIAFITYYCWQCLNKECWRCVASAIVYCTPVSHDQWLIVNRQHRKQIVVLREKPYLSSILIVLYFKTSADHPINVVIAYDAVNTTQFKLLISYLYNKLPSAEK